MIEITTGPDTILFSWDNIKNSYDEGIIKFNNTFVTDFYIKNIKDGFFISFNGLKFLSKSNKIIGTFYNPDNKPFGLNIINNIDAYYNIESYMISVDPNFEFSCDIQNFCLLFFLNESRIKDYPRKIFVTYPKFSSVSTVICYEI